MGYWLTAGLDYYEGDQRALADTAVSQRPYPTCTWNSGLSTWEYDLAATRIAHKRTWNIAASADIQTAFDEDGITLQIALLYIAMFIDAVTYTDNAANNSPFYDGYLAESGLANKAAVHAAIKNDYDIAGVVFGKVFALRDADFATMDAALTGPDILAVTYARPF